MSTIWVLWLGKSSNAQQQKRRGKDLGLVSIRHLNRFIRLNGSYMSYMFQSNEI